MHVQQRINLVLQGLRIRHAPGDFRRAQQIQRRQKPRAAQLNQRLERPREFEVSVVGDLTGKGTWSLTPSDGGVHIHFDWRVIADRPLLRILTPVLRPLFRWNHTWAIARAKAGLESYARARDEG